MKLSCLLNCQRQEIWYTFSIRNTLLRQKGCFMAQKVQVLLVDDLDGSEATETVTFGLDGASYEIDLSSGNAGKLRKELAHYVEHARKASSQARRRRARTGPGREQIGRASCREGVRVGGVLGRCKER